MAIVSRTVLVAMSIIFGAIHVRADDALLKALYGYRHDDVASDLLVSLAFTPDAVLADEDPICSTIISGEYVLDRDVTCAVGLVQIENYATLDLNGFTIEAPWVLGPGATIKNGTLLRTCVDAGVLENISVIGCDNQWAVQGVHLITGSYFQGNRSAVDLYFSGRALITDSIFEDNVTGIVDQLSDHTISFNQFRNNTTGITLWNELGGGVDFIEIANNHFEGNLIAINLFHTGVNGNPSIPTFQGNQIRRNHFEGNGAVGVLFNGTQCSPGGCLGIDTVVADNYFASNGFEPHVELPSADDGITLLGPSDANAGFTISGNVALGNADLGIEAPGATDGGGNWASGNGNPLQCVGVACAPNVACANALDDDGDGLADLTDPGCGDATSLSESPQCQDGVDNDGRAGIDFDGGASLDLDGDGFIDAPFNPAMPAVGDPDPQCLWKPWANSESTTCGLGAELAFLLPPLLWLRQRRRAARA